MSSPAQYTGLGVTLSINNVLMTQIQSVTPPPPEVGTVETTVLGSTWKTYIPTLPDGGEVEFTAILDPADTTVTAMFSLLGAPAVVPAVITMPPASGKKFSFSAILTKFSPSEQTPEGLSTYSGSLKVTGPVTLGS